VRVDQAIARILKAEGVTHLFAYPVNPIIETAAAIDIRPILVRQERVGLHMADAISRLSSGARPGVFAMQFGPGTENSFGGIAQAFSESVPLLVLAAGYPRRLAQVPPNFNAVLNFQHVTKHAEAITVASETPNVMRRAFSQVRNGRGGPVLIELPWDVAFEEVPEPLDYTPTFATRCGPDPDAVREAAGVLLGARRPVIYAGQGVHYARAWAELKALAERLGAPVATSLQGKSAFPEDHPLALGAGGRALPATVHRFIADCDVLLGIGCSFSETHYGVAIPRGKTIIHATLDPMHLAKDCEVRHALIGDAALTLRALNAEIEAAVGGNGRDATAVAAEIRAVRDQWYAQWRPKLESDAVPLSPYRVIRDLLGSVDVANTIVTHDAGNPRDQMSPFWRASAPLGYLGWGKTTQLGYGLGLAMGAKLACPDKLCINVWGDAAIGFTGMDFETAVRERIPILSILLNNSSMATELGVMPISTEKYRSTDISGDYAAMARAFGGYGERVTEPEVIVPAIRRGIEQTRAGTPALIEFITARETAISTFAPAAH
jgi:acetolactate synthase-1/2/3 large subunit